MKTKGSKVKGRAQPLLPFQCCAARLQIELLSDAAKAERMGLKSTSFPSSIMFHSLPSGSSQDVAECGFQPASRRVVMTAARLTAYPDATSWLAECVRCAGGKCSRCVSLQDVAEGARSTKSTKSERAPPPLKSQVHSGPWQWPAW